MIARATPKTGPRLCRLLYIEDHAPSIASVEALVAGRKDLRLLHAADANLGMELARRERPDVILINIDLPGPDGPVARVKMLRAEPAMETAPILALSANAKPEAVIKALEAGFFQCLAKPLQSAPFVEALDYALEFAAVERLEHNPLRKP